MSTQYAVVQFDGHGDTKMVATYDNFEEARSDVFGRVGSRDPARTHNDKWTDFLASDMGNQGAGELGTWFEDETSGYCVVSQ